MYPELPQSVVTDTGFWRGLCDKHDQHHEKSSALYEKIKGIKRFQILVPWPILYELLRTKFVKDKNQVLIFNKSFRELNSRKIDDSRYRSNALAETLSISEREKRSISLVDMLIRHMLQDRKLKNDYLVTYNPGDFNDVCKKHRIEIYSLTIK